MTESEYTAAMREVLRILEQRGIPEDKKEMSRGDIASLMFAAFDAGSSWQASQREQVVEGMVRRHYAE